MLLSCIDIPSVSEQTEEKNKSFLDFINHMAILGSVLLNLPHDYSTESVAENDYIKTIVSSKSCFLDGLTPDQDAAATKLLDAGLHVVFFNVFPSSESSDTLDHKVLREILSTFPRSRIGLILPNDPTFVSKLVQEYRDIVGNFLYKLKTADTEEENYLTTASNAMELQASSDYSIQFYFRFHADTANMDSVVKVATKCDPALNAVIYPSVAKTPADSAVDTQSSIDYVDAFIACLVTDRPDGMYSTVVCDDHGVCLGLVYSNKASIRAAFIERKGIYWSRSRNSLWRKGDSSGMFQELLGMSYDCDRDALRFQVVQHGNPPSFCHLMTKTCWGQEKGLQKLEALMVDRKKSAPVGSYTKRLFDDPDLLRKKLLEEVQELVEAEDQDHVAAEAADVIYFVMARCASAGVGIRDVERHLDQRSLKISRRLGNAKAWRTMDAEKVLEATKPADK